METSTQASSAIITDPLPVFGIIIGIVLVAPLISKKIRIPGIVGLILAGMLIGPNGMNLLSIGESIRMLSTAGLLYLMFLAGLELNVAGFRKSRNISLIFGVLTFFIPLFSGFAVAFYLLNYSLLASLLIASMFSTHTLISYPIASRLGITRTRAVSVSVGGTIITDTAVLLMLVLISAFSKGEMQTTFWLKLFGLMVLLVVFNLWLVPKMSRWFFKKLESDSITQFIYVIAVFLSSGMLAKAGGIEPIIGAFLTGLALSSIIPHTSALMNRVVFVGNALFIPVFLMSVGMLVDFRVFTHSYEGIIFSAILVVVSIFSKYLAAWFTGVIFRFSKNETHVVFGLSVSHAAAIIAVVLVGYQLKLISLEILNGTMLIILFSCLISSFITEQAGRKLALDEIGKTPDIESFEERILVPVANPQTIEGLIDFAILIKEKPGQFPIYMLTVVPDDEHTSEQILRNNKSFEAAINHAAASDTRLTLLSRVDLNVVNGIKRAMKEILANKIVIGWNGKVSTTDFFFGSLLSNLVSHADQMIMVVKLLLPLSNFKRIVAAVPQNAESETGCRGWVETVMLMAKRTRSPILFLAYEHSIEKIRNIVIQSPEYIETEYRIVRWSNDLGKVKDFVTEQDILVFIAARRRTVSFHHVFDLNHFPRELTRHFAGNSFVIIFPEQKRMDTENISLDLDGLDGSSFSVNTDRVTGTGEKVNRESNNLSST